MTTTKLKSIIVCSNCGSDNVLMKYWVNPNTMEINSEATFNKKDCYCCDCENNCYYNLKDIQYKKGTKVIGFQVVGEENTDNDGNIYPDIKGSFCVYSLSQCRKMGFGGTTGWRLLTIWTDDVEEPTMMFKGDPRN